MPAKTAAASEMTAPRRPVLRRSPMPRCRIAGCRTHLVCRSEKNTKKNCHCREHRRPPRLGHPRASGHQDKANHEAKGDEGLCVRQYRKRDDRCESGGKAGAHHETHGCSVSLVGPRREQDDTDRGKGDGPRTVWPCGHDPEELDGTDGEESALSATIRGSPSIRTLPHA